MPYTHIRLYLIPSRFACFFIMTQAPTSSTHSLYTIVFLFFFNDTATTEIYTLSLHDALPISSRRRKSTRLNSSHSQISYAVFCLKKKENKSKLQSPSNLRYPLHHETTTQTLARITHLDVITQYHDRLRNSTRKNNVITTNAIYTYSSLSHSIAFCMFFHNDAGAHFFYPFTLHYRLPFFF